MKTSNREWLKITGVAGTGLLLVLLTGAVVFGQTAPVLKIAHTGTNQVAITITNAIPADSYEIWWTPVLGDVADYPWATAAVGSIGQTNFTFNTMNGLHTGFFYALLDTNAIPLWEESNPSSPGSPLLKVTIANPTNGMTLN